jgi:hypothetical protein
MKLRFVGGHTQRIVDPTDPTGRRRVEVEQLSQVFETVEYFWPKPGSVLTVSAAIGGWLLSKHPKALEEAPDPLQEGERVSNRMVAIAPEDLGAEPNADAEDDAEEEGGDEADQEDAGGEASRRRQRISRRVP